MRAVMKKFFALPFLRSEPTPEQAAADPPIASDLNNAFLQLRDELLLLPMIPLESKNQFLAYYSTMWLDRYRDFANVFDVLEHRTNNDLEGWHTRMSKLLNRRENLWQFIRVIKDEQAAKEVEVNQIEHGAVIRRQSAKSINRETRITNLRNSYVGNNETYMQYVNHLSQLMAY